MRFSNLEKCVRAGENETVERVRPYIFLQRDTITGRLCDYGKREEAVAKLPPFFARYDLNYQYASVRSKPDKFTPSSGISSFNVSSVTCIFCSSSLSISTLMLRLCSSLT